MRWTQSIVRRAMCCGLRRRVVLAPLGWCQACEGVSRATVTNKVMDTGESTPISVKTIAQGMSMFRLHLWMHTRLRVQRNTRHSLRPLLFEDAVLARPGRKTRRGNAEVCLF